MILDSQERTLDISFRAQYKGKKILVYATTGNTKCFECGDVGHKRHTCPHKECEIEGSEIVVTSELVHTQGVEIEGPPEVRVTEVRVYASENTLTNSEVIYLFFYRI